MAELYLPSVIQGSCINKQSIPLNLCWSGGEEGYFTGMMLKKSRVKFLESEIVTYPTTQMMRNLLVAQVCAHTAVQILTIMCLIQLTLADAELHFSF